MTDDRMALKEALQKADDGNFLRSLAETVLQILIEAAVEGMIGASGTSGAASGRLNGYRERTLDTRLGQLNLRIPKLRTGSYFPPFLEARKTTEKALISVIQEAWIAGVSTRKVDDLVQAMGLSGISKSQVSKLCKEIDERVGAFLKRPLEGDWPYLWLDATYLPFGELERIINDLPDGGRHPNRTLGIGPDDHLYISADSTCNACAETIPESVTILRASKEGTSRTIFAKGLRNTIGFDCQPEGGVLWVMDQELNRLEHGKQFGWPYIYGISEFDPQDSPQEGITLELIKAMEGHVLAEGEIVGTYARSRRGVASPSETGMRCTSGH